MKVMSTFKFFRSLRNTRGVSITEVLIAAGIMSILSFAMMSMFQTQNQNIQSLNEKLLAVDLETSLKRVMANSEFCGCFFRDKVFDAGTKKFMPSISEIPAAYETPPAFPAPCTAKQAPPTIPAAGSKIGTSRVKIDAISVDDVIDLGAGSYTANMLVKLDEKTLVMPLKNIKAEFSFTVNASGQVLSCSSQASGSFGGMYDDCNCKGWNRCFVNPFTNQYSCPAGYTAKMISSFDDRGKCWHNIYHCTQ